MERISMQNAAIILVAILLCAGGCGDITIVATMIPSADTGTSSDDVKVDTASATDSSSEPLSTDSSSEPLSTDSSSEPLSTDSDSGASDTESDSLQQDTGSDTATVSEDGCPPYEGLVQNVPDSYPEVTELPNPFLFLNGDLVTSEADWQCRRAELLQLIQTIQYGPYPPAPDYVTRSLNGDILTVTVGANSREISFDVNIAMPAGTITHPFFIVISDDVPCIPAEHIYGSGFAQATFDPEEVANGDGGYAGKFYELYDTVPHTGNILAWAWAAHRIMDALSDLPELDPDMSRMAVVGCRHYGKASLLAGVFDVRVAFTVSSGSGSAGVTSWRAAEAANSPELNNRETIHNSANAPYWFTEGFISNWENNVYQLPFDAHEVISLIAPRPVVAQEGQLDEYGTNLENGPGQSMWAARIMYDWLNASDAIGWVSDPHTSDQLTEREIRAIMDLAKRFFYWDETMPVVFDETGAPPVISWSAPLDVSD